MKKIFICLFFLFSISEMMAQSSGVNIGSNYNGYAYQTYATSGTTGSYGYTLVGTGAANSNSDVDYSTYIGWEAGNDGSGTQKNTAVGYRSQYGVYNSSGDYNSSLGVNTLWSYTSGSYNSAFGNRALFYLTSGNYNISIGYESGEVITTGSKNTVVGAEAEASSSSASNQIVIGYDTVGQANNSVTLGNDQMTAVYMGQDSGATVYAAGLNLGSTAVTSTAAELNILDGVTATASEINIIDGVTATTSEINYVDGVTSNVQTQLDSKQATITGAATTITSINLAASRAVVSNYSGKVEVSAVTSTELGYLDGVTSSVQTQLDSKLSSSGNITAGGNIIIPDSGNIGSTSDTDAITIANNGNVTFGQDVTVSGDVVISSDTRLKSNIVSLGSTLHKLLQIDGKSYEMKGKQKIGVLAQEIKEVFPELVSENENEMLAVNYQGLVPVLINALKDQQSEIDELKEMVQKLISEK